jgi:N-acetylglucosaminyldiphosphoundecaprenol N-acetyl-beta-D-mannosaminyltransferase
MEAQNNEEFREVLNSTLSVPDSTGVRWAAKYLYGENIVKIPGVDLAYDICKLSAAREYRIFLLGGESGIAGKAKLNLVKKYKSLHVVGTLDGISINPDKEDSETIAQINRSKCNIIFVSLGAPKQELWIARNMDKLRANVFIGLGGTLDFISGKIPRAPSLFRKLNLEWLYRVFVEPRRLRRILRAVFVFPVKVILSKNSGDKTS